MLCIVCVWYQSVSALRVSLFGFPHKVHVCMCARKESICQTWHWSFYQPRRKEDTRNLQQTTACVTYLPHCRCQTPIPIPDPDPENQEDKMNANS